MSETFSNIVNLDEVRDKKDWEETPPMSSQLQAALDFVSPDPHPWTEYAARKRFMESLREEISSRVEVVDP